MKNLKKTSRLTNEKEISNLLKSLSKNEIKKIFKDTKEYYLNKKGKKHFFALAIEKILLNALETQRKWREFDELLNLYQKLNKEYMYEIPSYSVEIEKRY